ncbi:conserved hypothetical protein [Sporisorium reilianum SRZ2]|uniref:Uncharacterized protein n=1 Tax=Sporisorium reilianum (strain SRZ2) TaxID=999809 RepID=E6ZX88_SPORE|nr:conserved hypothetical protein [Sporisorium reilianum SRZ2]
MPFAYLRKQRLEQERLQQRHGAQHQPHDGSRRAIKVGLLAMLVAPLLFQLPWVHSAFGPGTRLPALWVRSAAPSSTGANGAECWNVRGGDEFRFCEDIEAIPGTAEVLISCDANRAHWNTAMGPLADAGPRGGLFSYAYPTSRGGERAEAQPVPLVDFPAQSTFHPLGMSILPRSDGGEGGVLFVVNHRRERSSVELFHLSPRDRGGWEAHWQRSIVHHLATHTPNSIHALTPTSFIVTNDHLFARRPGPRDTHLVPLLQHVLFGGAVAGGWREWIVVRVAMLLSRRGVAARLAQVETLLALPLGWASYVEFDATQQEDAGVSASRIATAIPFANGIALTHTTMFVAATTYPGLFIYALPPSPTPLAWQLRPTTKVHLPMRVDNLAWSHSAHSSHRTLLATGHPAPLALMRMARAPRTRTSASWSVAVSAHAHGTSARAWEDAEAPLPAHHFTLSHSADWDIRTLLQSTGEEVVVSGETVSISSSASSFLYADGEQGTLIVSGLYGPVLTCTGVSA